MATRRAVAMVERECKRARVGFALALAMLAAAMLAGGARAGSTRRFLISQAERDPARMAERVESAEMINPFRGAGPYDISREFYEWEYDNHTSRGYLFTPVARNDKGVVTRIKDKKFPALVFGHGLCAKADFYEHMTTVLSSWGYVVLVTNEFSECDYTNFLPGGEQVNTTEYVGELTRNAKYLASGAVEEANTSAIAMVGHSMGGGGSISAAAMLEESDPGLIKAVIAVAPWNGVQPMPSAQIPKLGKTPTLLICSAGDSLVPCSGPVTTEIVVGSFRMPFASVIPQIHGQHHGVDWNGGVLAIYENASEVTPAMLAVVRDANHLTIVDSDGEAGGTKLAEEYFSRFLEFPKVDLRPGGILPTIEYSVAWLEWVFRKDPQAFALLWGDDGIVLDDRFLQPVSRAATDS